MAQTKTLAELGLTAQAGRRAAITGVTTDSRAVAAGQLFAALPGTKVHGATYIGTALAQGAGAILTDADGAALAADALA
ncbi:MAG: UDP-N-acetylmuramoyl-L-alanyl-D-glutamate--2,6-diaminopimelate ligase, partial [Alphaproteobacteria bacterium]|nr:UDP-N-acetylmuramoyl-L-alanyl-D-glutamate--2,6-diaminopimelate ligase [Alphaproteobacteria bacterium]